MVKITGKILGLSGSIASGKNFIAQILQQKFAAEIFDADEVSHQLLLNDQNTILAFKEKFPSSYFESIKTNLDSNSSPIGFIKRSALAEIILQNSKNITEIEAILHPKIRQKYENFLNQAIAKNCRLVVLNIPLLLENSAYKCDAILAIIANKEVRKARFIARSLETTRNFYLQPSSKQQKIDDLLKEISNWLGLNPEVAGGNFSAGFLSEEKKKEYPQKPQEGQGKEKINKKDEKNLVEQLEAKFELLNQKQLSDEERLKIADFVFWND